MAGVALRIGTQAFSFSPGPAFAEAASRGYLNDLIRSGPSAFSMIAERYVEIQRTLPIANVPPTRPLYLFSAYAWQHATGDSALEALRWVSCLGSILVLILSGILAWRLAGAFFSLGVSALMATAPGQIAAAQTASDESILCLCLMVSLWAAWELLKRPRNFVALSYFAAALFLLVVSRETSVFLIVGFLTLIAANNWIHFGQSTPQLTLPTILAPIAGIGSLIALVGSAPTLLEIAALSMHRTAEPVSVQVAGWPSEYVAVLVCGPAILLLAIIGSVSLRRLDHGGLFLLIFAGSTLLLLLAAGWPFAGQFNVIFDFPARYLAFFALAKFTLPMKTRGSWVCLIAVATLCAIDLVQTKSAPLTGGP